MFWSLKENLGGLAHIAAAIDRIVFMRPSTHIIDTTQKKAVAGLSDRIAVVVDDFNKPLTCRSCGLAIMSFRVSDEYSFSCCSSLMSQMPPADRLAKWTMELPHLRLPVQGKP
ncbi:MAG: hypothetical protein IPP97_22195 [Candidatus Obscuribacter sp.]|mgnify:FL=1|nr:hypothetical protein [Candidatus Obscuribacter sp.]MBL0188442.1 hypothetical protein [Candidatus Obscuribacter sp.]